MKDTIFDAQLIAATPHTKQMKHFVTATMHRIKTVAPAPKASLWSRLMHLHRPVLALLALLAVALVGGAVYAAVQFAPGLIKILDKDTNSRGATEYSVAGYAECARSYQVPTDRFEVNSDAPALSDDDIQKILQAKCELQWINTFASTTWPTYGTNAEWKDGDQIYYARPDVMGKVTSVSDKGVVIANSYGGTFTYETVSGERLKAYQNGSEIPLGNIKPDDTIFTIVRVTETYHDRSMPLYNKMGGVEYHSNVNIPRVLGLLALVKLSLPDKYYGEMQNYLTEVPKCMGHTDEYCPNTPYIDVYPRGGEGTIMKLPPAAADATYYEISGAVTELGKNSLTLKASSGKLYTVTIDADGFDIYNRDFASAHTDVDAHLKVGSRVSVRYAQPKDSHATSITKDQVRFIGLLLESLNPKKGVIKPY